MIGSHRQQDWLQTTVRGSEKAPDPTRDGAFDLGKRCARSEGLEPPTF
jgi:hypothetical protein